MSAIFGVDGAQTLADLAAKLLGTDGVDVKAYVAFLDEQDDAMTAVAITARDPSKARRRDSVGHCLWAISVRNGIGYLQYLESLFCLPVPGITTPGSNPQPRTRTSRKTAFSNSMG